MYYDMESNLARYDLYVKVNDEGSEERININDLRRGIRYSLKADETCQVDNIKTSVFTDSVFGVRYPKVMQDILQMSGTFYYLGRVSSILGIWPGSIWCFL